jgi:glycosyltransferase involved in cell wall biosynthesis
MKILIVTPTFNSEKFIVECLTSVLNQNLSFNHITHVIKDGGSSDNTIGVVRAFLTRNLKLIAAKNIDIIIERSTDEGMYDAINQGVELGASKNVNFDIVFWLNSDDRLASDFIFNISKFSDSASSNWFIGRALDINELGEVVTDSEHSKINTEFLASGDFNYRGGSWLRAESVAIGYEIFRQIGGLDPNLKLAGDYDLFVKLSRVIAPTWVDFKVKEFRLHSGQLSNDLVKYEYERFSIFRKFNSNQLEKLVTTNKKLRVIYYPDYTSGNPYQKMMYESMQSIGFQTFEKLEVYLDSKESLDKFDVFHIQWLNDIMRRPREEVKLIIEKIKTHVKNLISAGKKIIFTIHNIGSHESINNELEKDLSLFLFQVCTKVHVHHSIVISQMLQFYGTLPWGRLVIAEHGPYSSKVDNKYRNNLLLQFGLVSGDRYVVVPGQIRKYKNLEIVKLFIEKINNIFNDVSIILAGQFHPELSEKDKSFFKKPNVRFSPIRLNDEQYNQLIQDSLFVFLSYKDISTSGSMFHALSNKALVLAPMLGTIPAYIDHGVTGFIYQNESSESLYKGIEYLYRISIDNEKSLINKKFEQECARLSWSSLQNKLFLEM